MTELEELRAREAIRETKARYCRLLDTKRWAEWAEVFTADVEMDVSDDVRGIPGAEPRIRGRDTIVSQTRNLVGAANYMHQVHSHEIDFVSDTEARVIWAMEDWVSFPDSVPQAPFRTMRAYGHYHETYVRDAGVWRIAALKLARVHKVIESR
jgi:hypothetical protein